jgi:thioredoxin reductase
VLVVDSREYRNRWVTQTHGYLGSDGADPAALLERARNDLEKYTTVQVLNASAASAQCSVDGLFSIALESGGEVHSRRLVLATGVRDEFPDIPGFFDYYGRSIFHCPSCDGYETRDRPVVVFGWDEHVAGFARGLLDWASSVRVVTDGRRFSGAERLRDELQSLGISVVEDEVVELCGQDGELEEVRLRNGGVVRCERAFFSIAQHPRSWLAEQLGCELTPQGCLSVDHEGRTSVAGIYGAGDVTPGMQYVATAVAQGTTAGTACALSLRDEHLGGPTGDHDRPERHEVIGGQDAPAPSSPESLATGQT